MCVCFMLMFFSHLLAWTNGQPRSDNTFFYPSFIPSSPQEQIGDKQRNALRDHFVCQQLEQKEEEEGGEHE